MERLMKPFVVDRHGLAREGLPMDATGIAKLIALLCLVALFIAAVLVTPRIWGSNQGVKEADQGTKGAAEKRGDSSS